MQEELKNWCLTVVTSLTTKLFSVSTETLTNLGFTIMLALMVKKKGFRTKNLTIVKTLQITALCMLISQLVVFPLLKWGAQG